MFAEHHPQEEHSHEVTPERLAHIWKAHRVAATTWPRSTFHCEGLIQSGTEKKLYLATPLTRFEPDEFITPETYLEDMISAAAYPFNHFCRLDELYSQLVQCLFVVGDEASNYDEGVVDTAALLLSRLPSRPVELALDSETESQLLQPLSQGYFEASTQNSLAPTQRPTKTWNNLVVATNFSANVIRVALLFSQSTGSSPSLRNLRRLADTTADLLEETLLLQRRLADNTERRDALFIVQAFLWSSWQRFTMLYFWYATAIQDNDWMPIER